MAAAPPPLATPATPAAPQAWPPPGPPLSPSPSTDTGEPWRPSSKVLVATAAALAVVVIAAAGLALSGGGPAKTAPAIKPVNAAIAEQQVAAALLPTPPRGYGVNPAGSPANGPIDAATAAKVEANPSAAAVALQQAGFQGGFARTWTRASPPGAIVDLGYQFASPAGARRYYNLYVKAQQNKPNTAEFSVPGLHTADGFTDTTDPALTLQTVVLLSGDRVFVVGIGDPANQATPADARGLAAEQAASTH